MIGLTSVVCSLMVASAPVIEDAPCHKEIAYVPSAQTEDAEGNTPFIPLQIIPLQIESITPVGREEEELYRPDQEPVVFDLEDPAATITPEAPLVDAKIDFKPFSVSTSPDLINLPVLVDANETVATVNNASQEEPILPLEKEEDSERTEIRETSINMSEVFAGAPVIYSLLFLLSLSALTLWAYHLLLTRKSQLMPLEFACAVEGYLATGNWQEALTLCRKETNLLAVLISASIAARHEGSQAMIERMQTEGKRATSFFWQRLSLLNDVALIAPMIGLLGTVLGMFYAFYDVNRSIESMYALFDGLGISVATTVGGLIVAIMALFFQSSLKYRLVRQFAVVESKAQQIALHPMAQPLNLQPRENHELST